MDFTRSERQTAFQRRVKDFMDDEVRPRQQAFCQERSVTDRWQPSQVIEELKIKARAADLWNIFLPPACSDQLVDPDFEFSGTRLSNLEYALCAEEMGRISWASEVFNCSAPDTGNMEVLHRYGSAAQKALWLQPLMDGEVRSAFLMTEPDVASSDATTA